MDLNIDEIRSVIIKTDKIGPDWFLWSQKTVRLQSSDKPKKSEAGKIK
jgi:hypothetical protein